MKEYRIGTDIKVRWQVTINNGAVPIEGADLTLQITNCLGQRMTLPHIITDGKVETIVYGKSQKQLGAYALTLWLNLGKVNQTAIDHIDAFRLVASSELIKDKTDSNNLQTGATVDLSGMMLTGIQGESAYEIWLRNGHTGTEADFVAWLKGPQGEPGTPGVPGNGIDHIEKTATEGKFDTYTIYFTDGTTYEYIVKNGEDAIADAYTKEESDEKFAAKSDLDDYVTFFDYPQIVGGLPVAGVVKVRGGGLSVNSSGIISIAQSVLDDIAGKFDKRDVVQTTGTATDKVMSQKAVSDLIGNVEQLLASI